MKLIQAVRGTKDIFGDNAEKYIKISEIVTSFYGNYNYKMIKTPIFEETDLFKRGIGEGTDVVEKEMYTFTDRGERSLTLRPEGTAPTVRFYLENKMYITEEISKFYYIGSMFRYERPQAGRQREFNQVGVEVLGESSPVIDAEVISMGYKFLEKLGIKDLELKINSIGGTESRKVYRERLLAFLRPLKEELCEDCRSRIENNPLRALDCKVEKCKSLTIDAPILLETLDTEERNHYEEVKRYLNLLNIKYVEDHRLVRGLDYYSSTVFEIVTNKLGSQGTVLAGGRYDNLLKQLGDKEIPAFGYAAGIERIMLLMELEIKTNPKVYIAWLGEKSCDVAIRLGDELRNLGIKVAIDYRDKGMKAHMKKADRLNVDYCVIIGEDEIEKNEYILKDFKNREQEVFTLEQLKERLI